MLSSFDLKLKNDIYPTHFTKSSSSLIDHILVSCSNDHLVKVCNQCNGISDHDLIFLSYYIAHPVENDEFYEYRDFKRINIPELCFEASNISWEDYYSTSDVNQLTVLLTSKLNLLLDSHAPLKKKAY